MQNLPFNRLKSDVALSMGYIAFLFPVSSGPKIFYKYKQDNDSGSARASAGRNALKLGIL